jgi:hypothetical protein
MTEKISTKPDDLLYTETALSEFEYESGTSAVSRLTALWALSEAALGGVLHAFKIPFTGLFIGSAAVLLITLISFFAQRKGEILRAAVIVLIVKAVVSPHTPVNAYAAVFLQGIIGELLFRLIKSKNIAALVLGAASLLLSAFQKLFVITVIFGMNIWNSIDLFGNYIVGQFMFGSAEPPALQISLILILLYVSVHLSAGIFIGLLSPKLGRQIIRELKSNVYLNDTDLIQQSKSDVKPKKRRFSKKLSGYLVFFTAFSIMVLSYIFPVFDRSQGSAAMIMVLRSITIMVFWYFIAGPFLHKQVLRILSKKEHSYSVQVEEIIDLMPRLKSAVRFSWEKSRHKKYFNRWNKFLLLSAVRILFIK